MLLFLRLAKATTPHHAMRGWLKGHGEGIEQALLCCFTLQFLPITRSLCQDIGQTVHGVLQDRWQC